MIYFVGVSVVVSNFLQILRGLLEYEYINSKVKLKRIK